MNTITIPDDALKRFRDAATKFTRDASPRASRLLAVKDDIAALRKKLLFACSQLSPLSDHRPKPEDFRNRVADF
jgi:hypothetical protein